MAQFYWRGNTSAGGRTVQGITGTVCFLPNDAPSENFDVCNWNVPSNWLKVVTGPTHGSSADFHYEIPTHCPGGGDEAIFECLAQDDNKNLDTPAPLSRCIFGGFWNEKTGFGWVNAGQTGGKCTVHVRENYGDNNPFDSDGYGDAGSGVIPYVDSSYYPDGIDGNRRTEDGDTRRCGPIGPYVGGLANGVNNERKSLVDASAGLGSTYAGGVNLGGIVSGLRLNCDSLICEGGSRTTDANPYGSGADINSDSVWEDGVEHGARFTDSIVDYCSLQSWRGANAYFLEGGTYGQIEQNCPVDPLRSGPDGAPAQYPGGFGTPPFDTMVDVDGCPDRSTYSQINHTPNFNITQSLYVGNTNIVGYNARGCVGAARYEIDNELPNFTYDSDFRNAARSCVVNADITNVHIYPQRRSLPHKNFLRYQPIVFHGDDYGSTGDVSSERTMGKLNMYDSAPGSTTRNVFERGENEEFRNAQGVLLASNKFKIRGTNNLVGLDNASWTIDELNLEGGRLAPGRMELKNWSPDTVPPANPYGDPQNKCDLVYTNEILIVGGDIFAKGAINTRNSDATHWKAFKIGGATLAPNTGAGLRVASRNAGDSDDQFVTGKETRIAVDYLAGNTGATFTSDAKNPVRVVSFRRITGGR